MKPYVPVNCEFHDVLEQVAMRRVPVPVTFVGDNGQTQTCRTRILDLQARGGSEYAVLEGAQLVRLDALVAVDGHALAEI